MLQMPCTRGETMCNKLSINKTYHVTQIVNIYICSVFTINLIYVYFLSRPGPYVTPLDPRKFCAPHPLFVHIQLCVSKNNTKNWQKTKHYSVCLGYKIKAKITKTTKY
jgi:hypothetical protein